MSAEHYSKVSLLSSVVATRQRNTRECFTLSPNVYTDVSRDMSMIPAMTEYSRESIRVLKATSNSHCINKVKLYYTSNEANLRGNPVHFSTAASDETKNLSLTIPSFRLNSTRSPNFHASYCKKRNPKPKPRPPKRQAMHNLTSSTHPPPRGRSSPPPSPPFS